MEKSYFDNKQCSICKGKEVKYRLIGTHHYYLCSSKQCDQITEARFEAELIRDK